MRRINFCYHDPVCIGSGYMGSAGLRRALEQNDLLDYAYSTNSGQEIDLERFQASPVLYVRGFLTGRMPYVARGGNQFKAAWQSESYYTRHGNEDTSTALAIENQKHFNMYFVSSETDLDAYDIPTVFLPSWAHTELMGDFENPVYEGLGFVGGKKGREDFLSQDRAGIINCKQTSNLPTDARRMTTDYARLISKFKMLVCPAGRCFNSMPGRVFEVMACNRLAFQYLNEDTMFSHKDFFQDGEDIVYFHDYDELLEKYRYYSARPEEAKRIAYNGYRKVRIHHNEHVRAHYIVNCMKNQHKRWIKDQAEIPEEINALYEAL